ncbi:MAG TPA: hypothetical protein VN948_16640 [Terriglobales bacterium]|nr:hypothetical protein [Terriglobales bacterium]
MPGNFAGPKFMLRPDQCQDGNSTGLSKGLQDYAHLSRTLHGDIKEGQFLDSFRPVRAAHSLWAQLLVTSSFPRSLA